MQKKRKRTETQSGLIFPIPLEVQLKCFLTEFLMIFFLGITKLHHYDGRKLFFQRYKLDNRFVLDYIKYTSLLVNLGATVREVKNIKTQQITRKDKIHSF